VRIAIGVRTAPTAMVAMIVEDAIFALIVRIANNAAIAKIAMIWLTCLEAVQFSKFSSQERIQSMKLQKEFTAEVKRLLKQQMKSDFLSPDDDDFIAKTINGALMFVVENLSNKE
jgi:hypothetical protein